MIATPIRHEFTKPKSAMMLLPIGTYLNRHIYESERGDKFVTSDGVEVEIISKTIIPANSGIAECLSQSIYGIGMKYVYKHMQRNWYEDMDSESVLLITIRNVKTEEKKDR